MNITTTIPARKGKNFATPAERKVESFLAGGVAILSLVAFAYFASIDFGKQNHTLGTPTYMSISAE